MHLLHNGGAIFNTPWRLQHPASDVGFFIHSTLSVLSGKRFTLPKFRSTQNASLGRPVTTEVVIKQRSVAKVHMQTNRQTDKQTNRQTDKQTNRQTDKQTNRQTDSDSTNSQTDNPPCTERAANSHISCFRKQIDESSNPIFRRRIQPRRCKPPENNKQMFTEPRRMPTDMPVTVLLIYTIY